MGLLLQTDDMALTTAPHQPPGGVFLWLARLAALIACGIACYLLWSASRVAGCGGNLACDQVLNSRWSQWFAVPVVLPGVVLYAAALLALGMIRAHRLPIQRLGWKLLIGLGVTFVVSAMWFLSLQWFVLHRFCGYCVSAHACGLVVAAFILWRSLVQRHRAKDNPPVEGAVVEPRIKRAGLLVGLLGSVALIVGQVLAAPRPQDLQIVSIVGSAGKTIELDTRAYPRLGSAEAQYVVIELLDYTCLHCRTTSAYLEEARRRYGPQLAIIPVVVPLHPACNRFIPTLNPRNEHAPEYARLALAVWQVKPAAFEAFHLWLVQSDHSPETARQQAADLVGAEMLARALAGQELDRRIQENVEVYGQFGGGNLPLLIYGNHSARGEPADVQQLFRVLEGRLGLSPLPGHE